MYCFPMSPHQVKLKKWLPLVLVLAFVLAGIGVTFFAPDGSEQPQKPTLTPAQMLEAAERGEEPRHPPGHQDVLHPGELPPREDGDINSDDEPIDVPTFFDPLIGNDDEDGEPAE